MEWNPSLIEQVETIAREAGILLIESRSALSKVNAAVQKDIKLAGDVAAEEQIRAALMSSFEWPVLGEELGGDSGLLASDQYYWVVDPLDGTHNYLREVPLCCVSIALCKGSSPILGVIYDFNRDELFSGWVGHGLYLNGQPWRSRWAESVGQASLQTGFPTGRSYGSEALEAFIGKVQQYKKVRMIGSAALALAWVAAGRFDVYFEEGTKFWDVAAGIALICAAGGYVACDFAGDNTPLIRSLWGSGRKDLCLQ
jgi:myo-inositol-1(or 4)-monophosphatase